MFCLSCDKKLRGIKEDMDYSKWQRKYHKKCWSESNIYYGIFQQCLKLENPNPEILEYYKKKSCIK